MTKVEQFEAIRRSLFVHERSIREAADEHGVHRRKVREAAKSAIPPPRKTTQRDPPVLTLSLREIVDQWLRDDVKAPRKQRHTGRQVLRRLRIEQAFEGAESAVRRYVGLRRRELGVGVKATVPPTHLPAAEGEVDLQDGPGGRSMTEVVQSLRPYLIGWKGYFRIAETPSRFRQLDMWIRRRLRAYQLQQWKRGKTAYRALVARGVTPEIAVRVAPGVRHNWSTAAKAAHLAMPSKHFEALGLPSLATRPQPVEPPGADPHAGW